jgi:hypothetical protein
MKRIVKIIPHHQKDNRAAKVAEAILNFRLNEQQNKHRTKPAIGLRYAR